VIKSFFHSFIILFYGISFGQVPVEQKSNKEQTKDIQVYVPQWFLDKNNNPVWRGTADQAEKKFKSLSENGIDVVRDRFANELVTGKVQIISSKENIVGEINLFNGKLHGAEVFYFEDEVEETVYWINGERSQAPPETVIKFDPNKLKYLSYHFKYIKWLRNPIPFGGEDVIKKIQEADKRDETVCLFIDENISDITPIAELEKLGALDLSKNKISDISPLKNLRNLQILHLNDNKISNLNSLSELHKLETLDLRSNEIEDISPIIGLKNLKVLLLTKTPKHSDELLLKEALPNTKIVFTPTLEISKKGRGYLYKGEKHGLWNLFNEVPSFSSREMKSSTGSFVRGKKHGYWVGWQQNGQKAYEGSFENGRIKGNWIFYQEDGNKSSEGLYSNAKKNGVWREWTYLQNGYRMSSGMYVDDLKEGIWVDSDNRGHSSKINFHNGNRHGPALLTEFNFFENIYYLSEGNYIKDFKDGLWISSYIDGGKKSSKNFKQGWMHGLSTYWDKNGQKTYEVNHKNGRQDGIEKAWYNNGQKKFEKHYKIGKLTDALVWKPDGTICPITKINNGNGVSGYYGEDGKLSIENYKDGIWLRPK